MIVILDIPIPSTYDNDELSEEASEVTNESEISSSSLCFWEM